MPDNLWLDWEQSSYATHFRDVSKWEFVSAHFVFGSTFFGPSVICLSACILTFFFVDSSQVLIEHLSSEETQLIKRSKTTAALLLVPGALFTVTYLILYKRSLVGHMNRFFGSGRRASSDGGASSDGNTAAPAQLQRTP